MQTGQKFMCRDTDRLSNATSSDIGHNLTVRDNAADVRRESFINLYKD